MRAASWFSVALLFASCVPLMRPAPATVKPDTPLDCTDTYWIPAGTAAGAAALLGYAAWVAHEVDEACDNHDPDGCDPQSPIAIAYPLFAGIGLAVAAEVGRRQVSRCRDARAWQRETSLPPATGEIGAACVPVYGGGGQCKTGVCVSGVCRPALPPSDDLRRTCAEARGRWRAGLLTDLPAACRSRQR